MSPPITPAKAREFALWVVQQLRAAGHEALWAGGCVRDRLLGLDPSDYDVATSATPDEVRACFGRGRTLAIGAAFGVITVLGRRDQGQVEVATFRHDSPYSDGRHPDHVTFSTARQDALRRDFTMNGIFYDPLSDQVIDYVGGQGDLRAGVVRAIGDPYQRIAEDKLRMLRAVRFATTFDFRIDDDTQAAIGHEASRITQVSAERITAELRKILVHPRRARGTQLLRDVRLLEVILPEARVLWDSAPGPRGRATEATWEHTVGILDKLVAPTFRVAVAGLLWGSHAREPGEAWLRDLSSRWKLSTHERKGLLWLLSHESLVRKATGVSWPRLQRVLIEPAIDELLALAEAVATQLGEDRQPLEFCRHKLALPRRVLDPPPLLTGDDLRRAGFPAGPLFRHILDRVRDAQLEGRLATTHEALALATEIARRDSADPAGSSARPDAR